MHFLETGKNGSLQNGLVASMRLRSSNCASSLASCKLPVRDNREIRPFFAHRRIVTVEPRDNRERWLGYGGAEIVQYVTVCTYLVGVHPTIC